MFIGLISDFMHIHMHIPRAYCLCIVSSLFIISQVLALSVSNVDTLWIATVLLGFAYGSLFGTMPAIMIEWFGLGKCIRAIIVLPLLVTHARYISKMLNSPSVGKLRMDVICSPHWREPFLDHVRARSRRPHSN